MELIQGGMGVAVSSWRLARAVSALGHLGVVSGTALDVVLARRLQLGDPDGNIRRAFDAFPDAGLAGEVLKRYHVTGGQRADAPFRSVPMFSARPSLRLESLAVLAGFVEVFLAKEGHHGQVGINFLQKVQLPTPAILYGALLAGVDYVLVGAGIPREIPQLLDRLVDHDTAEIPLHVAGALPGERFTLSFDPSAVFPKKGMAPLTRPRFLAIVSSATLAASLARNGSRVDGFVVEHHTAGGHTAPPRGRSTLSGTGEPAYGPRDAVDFERMREIGLPFWIAGGSGTPHGLVDAKREGAAGIQVGTLFAFCRESGLDPKLRAEVLAQVRSGATQVVTDPLASPTGFPFKVVQIDGTLSQDEIYAARERRCDLGYLRRAGRGLSEEGGDGRRDERAQVCLQRPSRGGRLRPAAGGAARTGDRDRRSRPGRDCRPPAGASLVFRQRRCRVSDGAYRPGSLSERT